MASCKKVHNKGVGFGFGMQKITVNLLLRNIKATTPINNDESQINCRHLLYALLVRVFCDSSNRFTHILSSHLVRVSPCVRAQHSNSLDCFYFHIHFHFNFLVLFSHSNSCANALRQQLPQAYMYG